jgi:hypothetical protein
MNPGDRRKVCWISVSHRTTDDGGNRQERMCRKESNIQERDLMSGMDTAKEVTKRKTFVASFSKFRDATKFCVRRICLVNLNTPSRFLVLCIAVELI